MNRDKPDSRELFRRIAKLSNEADWTTDETCESLSAAGIDPDDVANRVVQQVKKLTKESPLHWRQKSQSTRAELMKRVKERASTQAASLSRPQLLDKIRDAMRRFPDHRAAVAFSKFEEAPDEDLRSMLEELAVLEELGREENE